LGVGLVAIGGEAEIPSRVQNDVHDPKRHLATANRRSAKGSFNQLGAVEVAGYGVFGGIVGPSVIVVTARAFQFRHGIA
jgi:hypothetical protein